MVAGAIAHDAAPPTPDPRLAALVPYAKGEKLVLITANHRVEILDALRMASELKLKAAISGGEEAWKVVDAIKQAGVPVILGGTLRVPGAESDPYDSALFVRGEAPARGHSVRDPVGRPRDGAGHRVEKPPLRSGDGGRLRADPRAGGACPHGLAGGDPGRG